MGCRFLTCRANVSTWRDNQDKELEPDHAYLKWPGVVEHGHTVWQILHLARLTRRIKAKFCSRLQFAGRVQVCHIMSNKYIGRGRAEEAFEAIEAMRLLVAVTERLSSFLAFCLTVMLYTEFMIQISQKTAS